MMFSTVSPSSSSSDASTQEEKTRVEVLTSGSEAPATLTQTTQYIQQQSEQLQRSIQTLEGTLSEMASPSNSSTTSSVLPSQNEQKPWSALRLFMLVVGMVGIQFAWSIQISHTSTITEPLGADPLMQSLIWWAGPITGLLVQPTVGAISDKLWLKGLGRRTPFMVIGTLVLAWALFQLPFSQTLLQATVMICLMDTFVNTSQGPYRALIPDIVPEPQSALGNSWYNLAVGLGSVLAFGFPALARILGFELSVEQQCHIASVVLLVMMGLSIFVTREYPSWHQKNPGYASPQVMATVLHSQPQSSNPVTAFMQAPKAIHDIALMTVFMWMGLFSLFIYLTPYVQHHILEVPDLANPALKALLAEAATYQKASPSVLATLPETLQTAVLWLKDQARGAEIAQLGMMSFNLVSMLLALPIGKLADTHGAKPVLTTALGCMALAFVATPFIHTPELVWGVTALCGVAWGAILSLPFSMMAPYLPKGQEGKILGVYNIFICVPQLIISLIVGNAVKWMPYTLPSGYSTYNYSMVFVFGILPLLIAMVIAQKVQEKKPDANVNALTFHAGGH
ncbi:MAG: MFS transporter [Vampirovibrionales bacterium]